MNKYLLPLLIFGLASCTVGPDYKNPELFKNEEIQQALELKLPVGDNPPFQPEELNDKTLDALIAKAVQNSPTIKIARLRVMQSRANLQIKEVGVLPVFDAVGKYNYVKESRNMGLVLDENYYQVGVDASWEIDIFGGLRRQTEAAGADYGAQIENLKNVQVSLVAEVALAYVGLRTTEDLLAKAEENLKIQADIYQLVKDEYETGLVGKIDLEQAEYQLETTRASIPELSYQKVSYQNSLALLVGELPGSLNEILAAEKNNLVVKPFAYDLNRFYELPAEVVRNRPDVKSAEQALIAQNALVGAAIAEMYPKVTLSGLFGFESLKFSNLFNLNKSYGYSYVPQIGLPIFHFGAIRNNVKLQESLKEEQLVAYELAILQAAEEIKNVLTALDTEMKRNASLEIAYQKINKAAELTKNKYQSGLVGYTSVLDVEQRRINAQNQMTDSKSNLYQNVIKFYKAIGGSFAYHLTNG